MRRVTVEAHNEQEAAKMCEDLAGFEPQAIREVGDGAEGLREFMCFESKDDAEGFDKDPRPNPN